MTLSRPRTTGRVLRGSALGLGLLVAGGVTAPAASAIEGPTDGTSADTPEVAASSPAPLVEVSAEFAADMAPALNGDFGTGKDFTVQVQTHGPVPGDLDLSGAVFRATPVGGGAESSSTCTTDMDGACDFDLDSTGTPDTVTSDRVDAVLPAGDYVLTQDSASPGLDVNTGSGTFTVCDGPDIGTIIAAMATGTQPPASAWCDDEEVGQIEVGNDSLFRTSLVTTVTDVETGEPLACAGYELTGPDYPHDGTAVAPSSSSSASPTADPCADTTSAPVTTSPTTTAAPVTTTAPETSTTSTTSPSPEPDTTTPTTVTPSPSPYVLDLVGEQPATVSYGTGVSDADGVLVFEGYFIPGDSYLLTPTDTPEGYRPDVTDGFGITTTAAQAAMEEPAAAARALQHLAAGASAPALPPLAGAATTSAPAAGASAAAATTTAPAAAGGSAALAVTGTPVGTIALLGGGLLVLGGGALAAGTVPRRRARRGA